MPSDVTVWINEIHYDNDKADVNEGVELAGKAGTDLTGWTLVLYNGAASIRSPYATINLKGTIPDEGKGYGAIWFPADKLENGGSDPDAPVPDGIALVDNNGKVVQFLSYEGAFDALNGPAKGIRSVDIGVSETGTTPLGTSLQLTGSGTTYSDFKWETGKTASPGKLNDGQTIP